MQADDDGNVVTLHLALVFPGTFNKVWAFKADDLNDLAWFKSNGFCLHGLTGVGQSVARA